MIMDVTCSQCGAVYHSDESHVGKHLRCTRCGSTVPILNTVRNIVSQPTSASPTQHVNRAPTKTATRSKSAYMVWAALGLVLAAGGVGLTLHFRNSDLGKTAAHQQSSQPESSPEWTVVGEEAAPQGDKTPTLADTRPTEYNSLPTGARIEGDVGTGGHGELEVENGNEEDAVVRLALNDSDETVRWFFVKAHRTARMHGIPAGNYRLTFTSGLNWVASEDSFSWHPTYSEFERPVEFKEQRDSEGIQYHTFSVTLHSVPFGNIHTRTITREEFLRGHKHLALQ
jgi:DNA-directed RNA polymerase subunit RPC12/RpoP